MVMPAADIQEKDMGRVVVPIRVENLNDLWSVRQQLAAESDVRKIAVDDALVDTGCIGLALPSRLIQQLGLQQVRSRSMRTTNGIREARIFDPVQLTIQDRTCTVEVYEVPDSCPALVGQIPLEILDFVVDLPGQRLIGNPLHGGEWMNDLFAFHPADL
jgi:predicted aspartyl protease